ncbi:hypothetical protein NKR23_g1412 [Pleurostoma richardsiae]|uniref:Enoyl reductase (ER) domain-containing protein n=1 Tax=Pleurostoma richardsiae TaxID=41990 RepID=A0AA38VJS7_9PEZI|nr:hypothetical protein NKR23_g1412 [Pleurostoma richardsiae]
MSHNQTSLILREIGKPLTKTSLTIPKPEEHEVLVRVSATGLTPLDWKLRDVGVLGIGQRLPAVMGLEISGRVVGYGSSAAASSGLPAIGSRIILQPKIRPHLAGGLEEYTLANPKFTIPIPPNVTEQEAATLGINPLTAAIALFHSSGFGLPFPGTPESQSFDYRGVKLVIIGGGTSVAKFTIQQARIAGIGTIIAIASPSSFHKVLSYGATHTINRHSSDITTQVHSIVGDDLKYVFDTISFGHPKQAISFFQQKGGVVCMASSSGLRDQVELDERGITVKGFHSGFENVPDLFPLYSTALQRWLSDGSLNVPPFQTIPSLDADLVNKALDDVKQGRSGVKYVVNVRQS